jgi:hypothetical protein
MKKVLFAVSVLALLTGVPKAARQTADGNPFPTCPSGQTCKSIPPALNG